MWDEWEFVPEHVRIADMLDIAIVAATLAVLLRWWARRRKPTLLLGGFVLAVLYAAAFKFELYMTRGLLQAGLPVLVFGLLVLFREDLRFEVERLRTRRFFGTSQDVERQEVIDVLAESAALLSSERIGALIVIPREQGIDRFVRAGTELDACVSVPLIHSLFHPNSQGHDGAVVLRSGRLERFGVHLPLSGTRGKIAQLGTRHTAALGLCERTDAVIVVVSEETGAITLAIEGELRPVAADQLASALAQALQQQPAEEVAMARATWLQGGTTLATALGLTLLAWYVFAFRVQTIQRTFTNVSVELHHVPNGLAVDGPFPGNVSVTLAGPERVLETLEADGLRAVIDLAGSEPQPWLRITRQQLRLPDDVELLGVVPEFVRMAALAAPPTAPPGRSNSDSTQ